MKFNFRHEIFLFVFGAVLIFSIFLGCRERPYPILADLYASVKPMPADVVGPYDYEMQTLINAEFDPFLGKKCSLELKANGTFLAENIPNGAIATAWGKSWRKYRQKKISRDEYLKQIAEIFGESTSASGKWNIIVTGDITTGSEGYVEIWGIHLESKNRQMGPIHLLGKRRPYGLVFGFGDPDRSMVLILKKRD